MFFSLELLHNLSSEFAIILILVLLKSYLVQSLIKICFKKCYSKGRKYMF